MKDRKGSNNDSNDGNQLSDVSEEEFIIAYKRVIILTDRFYGRIFEYSGYYKLDPEVLVNTAFCKTAEGIRNWNREISLTTHIMGAVKSEISSTFNSSEFNVYKKYENEDKKFSLDFLPSQQLTPEQEKLLRESTHQLRDYIYNNAKLFVREIFDIVQYKGIPLDERSLIAEILGLDPQSNSNMQRVYRAIKILKKFCDDFFRGAK